MNWSNRRGHGALILVVLLSIAIILVLAFGQFGGGGGGGGGSSGGGGGGSYVGAVSKSRKQGKAMAQDISTQQLTILIAQYRDANNRLPKSPADMEDSQVYFKDPWGGEMTFSFEDQRGKTIVTFRSKGPDGEAGTEDDVSKTDALPY